MDLSLFFAQLLFDIGRKIFFVIIIHTKFVLMFSMVHTDLLEFSFRMHESTHKSHNTYESFTLIRQSSRSRKSKWILVNSYPTTSAIPIIQLILWVVNRIIIEGQNIKLWPTQVLRGESSVKSAVVNYCNGISFITFPLRNYVFVFTHNIKKRNNTHTV